MKGQSKTKQTMIQKRASLNEASEYAENIINTVREPLIVLDQDLRVVTASRSFYEFFKVKPEETVGQLIYNLGDDQWNIPKLRELLENILPEKTTFDNYEVEHDFATIGKRIMLLNARQIKRALGKERIILLAIEDITKHKQLESLLIDSEKQYRRLFETASDGIVLLEKREGKITQANPATEKLLGYTEKESIGNKLQDIGVVLDMGDFQTTMQNLNKSGIINYRNVKVETKSGQNIDTEIYLVDRAKLVQCNIRDITEHKWAEEELQKSEKKYRDLYDFLPIPVYEMDLEANIISANRAIYEKFGGTEEDLKKGFKAWQLLTPEAIDKSIKNIQRLLNGEEQVIGSEYTLKKLDGSEFPAIVISSLIYVHGKPVGLRGAIIDITERKQTEETILQGEKRFKVLYQESPIPTFTWKKKGDDFLLVDFNNAANLLTEGKVRNFMGTSAQEMYRKRPDIINDMYGCFKKQSTINRELVSQDFAPGKFLSVYYSYIAPDLVITHAQDITEMKQAAEALRKSEEKYRTILKDIQEGYFEVDFSGNFTFFNDSLRRFLGYSEEELMGMNNRQYTDKEHSKKLFQAFNKVYNTGEPIEDFDWQIIRKDGTKRYVEASISLQKDSSGKPIGFRGIARDVTDRKKVEEELKESEKKYRLLADNVDDVIFVLDMNLNYTYASPSVKILLGYEQEELLKLRALRR